MMRIRSSVAPSRRHRRGAAIALLCILLPIVLMVSAFAINVVYMEMTRTELQIATDVATRAAGRTLAVTGDTDAAKAAAYRVAAQNPVANQPLNLADGDFIFGASLRSSENERYQFKPAGKPNAVRLRSEGFAANTRDGADILFPGLSAPTSFRPIKTAISTQVEMDIALVLDRSGSMIAPSDSSTRGPEHDGWTQGMPVPLNSRWIDMVLSVDQFLTAVKQSIHTENVSLSTYSAATATEVKLSDQYDQILVALNSHSAHFTGKSTQIGLGILEGIAALNDPAVARPWAARILVLMSDGLPDPGFDPIVAAHRAADADIMIYTISYSDKADQTLMAEIARIGAGKHYYAADARQLKSAFTEIAKSLPTLITF